MQNVLQMNGYRIFFKHKDCSTDESVAYITVDSKYKFAEVFFSTIVEGHLTEEEILSYAKHEAIHLFLSQLTYLAEERYVAESEIARTDELMTVVLENLL